MKCLLCWPHMFIHSSVSSSVERAGEELGDMNQYNM